MILAAGRKSIRMPQEVCVLGALLVGLIVGMAYRPQCVDILVFIALFLMLFPPMLEVDFPGIRRALTAPRLVVAALFLNFLVSPLLMFGLLHLFGPGNELTLMIGIILYSTVPGGGMAPAFTGMLNGNVNLSVTIAAIGGILSLAAVPLWTYCLIGARMDVPCWLVFRHLCFIIAIPLILAAVARRIIVRKKGESAFCTIKRRIKPLSSIGLSLLLFAMCLLYARRVMDEPLLVLRIAAPVFSFLLILFLLSGLLGRALSSVHRDAVALTLSTTAKNNAVSLALAFSAFGPDAGLVNAIAGPLVQLPMLLSFVALKKGRYSSNP